MDVWKGCWGTFAELSCKHTLQILSCTHSTHTAALTLSALYVITASLQTTVGVLLLLSHVMMMDQSGAAAGVSYCSRALPLHCLVSTILAPLCRGKAAASFPAAAACSNTVCVPTAECAQCVPTLQHCSMTPPCSRAPVVVRRLRMR